MNKLLNLLKILGLIFACFLIAFILVWPLWKFALSSPKIYTIVVLVLFAALILFFIIKKIINKAKK